MVQSIMETSCPQTPPSSPAAHFRACTVQLNRDRACDARVRQQQQQHSGKCFASASPTAHHRLPSSVSTSTPVMPYALDRRTREITASLAASHEFTVSFTYPTGYTPRSILVSSSLVAAGSTSRNKSVSFSAQRNQVFHRHDVDDDDDCDEDDDEQRSDGTSTDSENGGELRRRRKQQQQQQITVSFSTPSERPSRPLPQHSHSKRNPSDGMYHIDVDDNDDDVENHTESDIMTMAADHDPLEQTNGHHANGGGDVAVKPKRGRPRGSFSNAKDGSKKRSIGRPPATAVDMPKKKRPGRPPGSGGTPKKEKALIHLKFKQLLKRDRDVWKPHHAHHASHGQQQQLMVQRFGAKFFHARVRLSRNVNALLLHPDVTDAVTADDGSITSSRLVHD